ncbi:MAG: hypothetical protein QOG64_3135 [Acidimicrobiaceae bacterium]|nr:hypothetical protein [Acidimicrobiaceae bacterium]
MTAVTGSSGLGPTRRSGTPAGYRLAGAIQRPLTLTAT